MKVYHWWPGRTWAGPCPIPSGFVEEAKRLGSRYLTFARAETKIGPVIGYAYCCPKDVPSRKMGRQIALGRIEAVVNDFQLELIDAIPD